MAGTGEREQPGTATEGARGADQAGDSSGRAGAGGRFAYQAHELPRGLPRTTRDLPIRSAAGSSDPTSPGLISTDQVADNLQRTSQARRPSPEGLSFRVNNAADIKSMLAAKKVSEKDLKEGISLALMRMAKEKLLLVADPIPDIMKRLFPAPGKFDEAELAKVVDVKDRSRIYENIDDTWAEIRPADEPKLKAVIDDASKTIDAAMGDATGLKQVFGTKDAEAKARYASAKAALATVKANMATALETDYNRDDEQIGLGGWANFVDQHIHLTRKVAEVHDAKKAQITIIHECAHLANAAVRDHGYYGSPGFEGLPDEVKVNNAAHYEELPARALGISKYSGVTFTPGKAASGKAETFEDKVKRDASEYLRKAWDSAINAYSWLRDIRMEQEGGSDATFKAYKKSILRLSKLQHLTIHKQKKPKTVEMIDIVLSEGVTRATALIQKEVKGQPVPAAPKKGKKKKDYVRKVINGAVKAYGALTGSHASDMELIQYLVRHYKKGF
jgi:hypothetical protein